MRTPLLVVMSGVALMGGCASPRAIGDGDIANLKGGRIAAHASAADRPDATFIQAVEVRAVERLKGGSGTEPPRLLVQVGIAEAPASVGVSSPNGALAPSAWRSPPERKSWWRFWGEAAPERTVTLVVIDVTTGKTVAWSSIRTRDVAPAKVADLLTDALDRSRRR